ncbi:transposase [Microbispora sp. GKU 823]|uniref:transposase n=1 Tax=Microbispora sp. GKU 823 TaxID=1652100 RepID=UPI003566B185
MADSVDPDRWVVTLNELVTRIAHRFSRIEPRRAANAYVRGLLSDVERKNCWNLAEHAGLSGPQTMQRLLRTARWDAEAVRDDVRGYVSEHLGGDGVPIVDETGFLKKGLRSADVQRQYSGTATGELAFYRCYAPRPTPLAALVRIAGIRWTVEESFQAAKGQVWLDHYQVRSRDGWYRHITLAMLALAFLAVLAAFQPDGDEAHPP